MYPLIFVLLVSLFDTLSPPDVRKCTLDGKDFVCFTPEDTQVLLEQRLNYVTLELKVQKLEEKLGLKESEIIILNKATTNLTDQIAFFSTENTRLQVQVNNQTAWYKSPYLWTGVGLLLGAGTSILIFYSVK